MIRRAGACLGLFAFCVTILRGLAVGNPAEVTLTRALWAMAVFCLLGLVLGYFGHLIVTEHEAGHARKLAEELKREAGDESPAAETATPTESQA